MRKFDETDLANRLRALPSTFQAVFAASCASRLFKAYVTFHERTGLGNPNTLERALSDVWQAVLGRQREPQYYEEQLRAVMALLPDESERWSELHAYADDAVSVVAYALRNLLSRKPEDAAWAARRVYEAIDHYIISTSALDVNRAGVEQQIASDALIQAELSRQIRDIDELTKKPNSMAIAESFKARAERESALPL